MVVTVESLLARSRRRADSECREWTGPKTRGGYGTLNGTTVHRLHPDTETGSGPEWLRLIEARRLLEAHLKEGAS